MMISKSFFWVLSVTLLISSQNLFSQCKLESKTDEFSSIKTINSPDVTLVSIEPFGSTNSFWNLDMCFKILNNALQIQVTHASQSYSSRLDFIYFKFKDGTLIKKTEVVNTGNYNSGHGYDYTYTTFSLTKDELLKFSSTELDKFQAEFTHFTDYAHIEKDIKTKSVGKILKDANCILSELNKVQEALGNSKENSFSESETSCKYEKDLIDDFTKKRIVLTKPGTLIETKMPDGSRAGFSNVCGSNINGVNGLKFSSGLANIISFNDGGASLGEALKFDQVDILLENDEVVSLQDKEASEFSVSTSEYSSSKLFTILDANIWNKLKTTPIKKMRVLLNSKEKPTQEIDKQFKNAIIKVISCIDALSIPK
jgi:hypothetical protein